MKIAFVLAGVSSGLRHRDWNRTKLNIKEKAIDCWLEQNHEVKTYLTSNHLPEEMIEFYNPTRYQFDIANNMMLKHLVAVDLLKDQDVDFIIFTRFDIVFFNKISTWDLNFDKFNFLFREKNHFYDGRKMTCDNFYAFPKCYLDSFGQALLNPDKPTFTGSLHNQVYTGLEKLIGENNIHFIEKEEGYSGSGGNVYYVLDRYNIVDGDLGPTSIEKYYEWKIGNPDV